MSLGSCVVLKTVIAESNQSGYVLSLGRIRYCHSGNVEQCEFRIYSIPYLLVRNACGLILKSRLEYYADLPGLNHLRLPSFCRPHHIGLHRGFACLRFTPRSVALHGSVSPRMYNNEKPWRHPLIRVPPMEITLCSDFFTLIRQDVIYVYISADYLRSSPDMLSED